MQIESAASLETVTAAYFESTIPARFRKSAFGTSRLFRMEKRKGLLEMLVVDLIDKTPTED